ncbi:UNVERIFIED_CONTAM: hypothetical protein RMT77_008727 [Armadillidium vulgare]
MTSECKLRKVFFSILLFFYTMVDGYVFTGFKEHDNHQNESLNSSSCLNGKVSVYGECVCRPCWEGVFCNRYTDYYAPRFLVHKATAVVPSNVTGAVYRAWSSDEDLGLTCPLGPGESTRCPCASVRYQLFSPPGDHHFALHPDTGILSRTEPPPANLEEGTTYTYKLMVQSTPVQGYTEDLLYDILDLEIFVGNPYIRKIPWT